METLMSLRERRALTILNILLIVLPLLLLLLFFLAMAPRKITDTTLTYTLRFYPVREEYAAGAAVGDSVLDAVGKRVIGEVVAVERTPALTESYDAGAGKLRKVPYPGYTAITLTVRARARTTEGGYQIGPFLLFRGKKMHVRLPHMVATGFCTDIQRN